MAREWCWTLSSKCFDAKRASGRSSRGGPREQSLLVYSSDMFKSTIDCILPDTILTTVCNQFIFLIRYRIC